MRFRYTDHIATALVPLLSIAYIPVASADAGSYAPAIKVTSCSVRSTRDSNKAYDCAEQAAKVCNGQAECELQIGYNLTAGKDIEPGAGYLGKTVTVSYDCGDSVSRQRGPYPQSDHANLILECWAM